MDQCLLMLVVSPSIENAVIDWLLEYGDIEGFTSMPVNGHGVSIHSMSLAEQVTGRKGQVMFMIHLPVPAAQQTIEEIRQVFSGSGMHYWLVPVMDTGRV